MNVQQTSKITRIPIDILIRMRSRGGNSYKSGPPFHKVFSPSGEMIYVYLKQEVQQWMQLRRCMITAGDAAEILGLSRAEVLNFYGLRGFTVKHGSFKGRLIVNNGKNQYIWLPIK